MAMTNRDTAQRQRRDTQKGQKPLPANYGDASPEEVARAILAPALRRRLKPTTQ